MTVEPSPSTATRTPPLIEERVASLLELMTIEEDRPARERLGLRVVKDNHLSPPT